MLYYYVVIPWNVMEHHIQYLFFRYCTLLLSVAHHTKQFMFKSRRIVVSLTVITFFFTLTAAVIFLKDAHLLRLCATLYLSDQIGTIIAFVSD